MMKCSFGLLLAMTLTLSLDAGQASAQTSEKVEQKADMPAIRTGQYSMRFRSLSSSARYRNVVRRTLGRDAGDAIDLEYARPQNQNLSEHSVDLVSESFEVFVPPQYDGSKPFGLFVYISALDSGRPPKAFLAALEQQSLIFVAANKSGNGHDVLKRRVPLALHAAHNMSDKFNIDPKRIYVTGLSGGAKVAGFLGVSFGDIFRGALHIVGSRPIGSKQILMPDEPLAGRIKASNRYVFLTGKYDFNRKDVRRHYRGYGKLGFCNTTLIDVKDMKHELPSQRVFKRAIAALEGKNGKQRTDC